MSVTPKKKLIGNQIILELPAKKHSQDWIDVRSKNFGFLQPWEPRWDPAVLTPAGYKQILKKFIKHREEWRNLVYFIIRKSDQKLVGGITLGNIRFGSAATTQLGYWMGEEYTRKGYMQEALAVITRYAFTELYFERLEAYCMDNNRPSINLLKKCNFKPEGEARGFLEINGFREDHLAFSLLKSDLIDIAQQRFQEMIKKN